MSSVTLANLPTAFKDQIETRLKTKVTIKHPRTGIQEEKTFLDALIFGVNFKYRDVTWNVKVAGDGTKTFIRLSSADSLQAFLFENNGSKIRHCKLSATPDKTEEEPLPPNFECFPALCPHTFFFTEVILSGECEGPASPQAIPQSVHQVATEWFQRNAKRASYLIPLAKYEPPSSPEFDPMARKVDDEAFKKVFKVLGIIAGAYFVYQVVIQLFQLKKPAPVPLDAPPAVLVI